MDKGNPSRRQLLQSISTAGVGIGSVGKVSGNRSYTDRDSTGIEVREATGRSRNAGIQAAKSNNEYNMLHQHFVSNKLRARKSSALVRHVKEREGEERYVVSIPYVSLKHDGASQTENEFYILYTGIENVSNRLSTDSYFRNIQGYKISETENSTQNNMGWNITNYLVDENIRTVSSSINSSEYSTNQDNNLDPGGGSCSTCYRYTASNCDSINWGCFLTTAGAYVTTITVCGVCGFSAGVLTPACGYCLGGLLTSAGVTIGCDIGGGCSVTSRCVPTDLESDICT